MDEEEKITVQETLEPLLNVGGLTILDYLNQNGGSFTTEIIDGTGVHNATCYRRFDELKDRGLLMSETTLKKGQKRVKTYEITEKGQKILEELKRLLEVLGDG